MRSVGVRVLGPVELDGEPAAEPTGARQHSAPGAAAADWRSASTSSRTRSGDRRRRPTWPKQLQATIGHIRRALPGGCGGDGRRGLPARAVARRDRRRASSSTGSLGAARSRVGRARPSGQHLQARTLPCGVGSPFADLDGWAGAASEVARLTELRADLPGGPARRAPRGGGASPGGERGADPA